MCEKKTMVKIRVTRPIKHYVENVTSSNPDDRMTEEELDAEMESEECGQETEKLKVEESKSLLYAIREGDVNGENDLLRKMESGQQVRIM